MLQRSKPFLKCHKDVVAVCHDLARVALDSRQHPRGTDLLVPGLLLPVAEHRHLAHLVRHLLLLQPEPDLLAVGTPSMVIPEQGQLLTALRSSEGEDWPGCSSARTPCLR